MMPHLSVANQPDIGAQRSERNLDFLVGNKPAIPANDLVNAVKKQRRTLHYIATQHDGLRSKYVDQIGQAETQVRSHVFDRASGPLVACLGPGTDFPRSEIFARITLRCVVFHPCHDCRPLARLSQQPRAPQEHSGPEGSMT